MKHLENSHLLPELNEAIQKVSTPPNSKVTWALLNDIQKAQVLLNGIRLLDAETFLTEFKSFEQPETNSLTITNQTL